MGDKFQRSAGLLVVFMEPGSSVTLEEFHEWYDTEHVPLRIQRFPSFRSAARYAVTETTLSPGESTDSVKVGPRSSWAAFYTISDNSVFSDVSYTSLREERSKREAELFTRLAIVDRRIYALEYDSDADDRIGPKERKRIGLNVQLASDTPKYVVTNSVDVVQDMQEEYARWFEEEHVVMLAKVPGWRRSRRFRLIDNGVNGKDAKSGDAEGVPKIMGMHEYDNDTPEQTPEFQAATTTAWRSQIVGENNCNVIRRERKTCSLYRAWDPIAALKAQEKRQDV
ncbi:uncharacterized protein UTRI_00955_B [Ustilago trichophora]|uniref:EthD domain-containing protein n=1 Tax=Ustilago trichophora TaxID=86804 RepID=A0A5C3DSR7_9BASI|nr:uncharacterized protein UTRI_00955_B [Ustilago trichophora]